jgi:hypothetical protein
MAGKSVCGVCKREYYPAVGFVGDSMVDQIRVCKICGIEVCPSCRIRFALTPGYVDEDGKFGAFSHQDEITHKFPVREDGVELCDECFNSLVDVFVPFFDMVGNRVRDILWEYLEKNKRITGQLLEERDQKFWGLMDRLKKQFRADSEE